MRSALLLIVILTATLSGCTSVQMEPEAASNKAKEFNQPSEGTSGVYIYRQNTYFGNALKKKVWTDGKCIGENVRGTFFYQEVEGNKEHRFSTEPDSSPNDIIVTTALGELYFIELSITFGAIVAGAELEQKEPDVGKKEIKSLLMATKSQCNE